jgi:hypothetical protein
VNTLSKPEDREHISTRLSQLSPQDAARWGTMSVHQMICHLDDSYKTVLGAKQVSSATGFRPRPVLKWLALKVPMKWPHNVPTRPEVEQGKGGSPPADFRQDLASLLSTFDRFCAAIPEPCLPHPFFGPMTVEDWMRWGYLHPDHHLRQFGR